MGVLMTRGWLSVWVALAVISSSAGGGSARADETTPHRLAAAALRVLKQRCGECHGRGDLDHGAVRIVAHGALQHRDRDLIVPRQPDASTLLTRVEVGSMPPGKRAKLTAEEQQTLRKWIAQGAPSWHGTDYVVGHLLD